MKIAIPTNGRNGLEEIVSDHFGRCDTYTVLDNNGNFLSIIENTSSHNGGQGLPPELLKENNIDILLCRGLGPKALDLCRKIGIDVYVSLGRTASEIFNNWKGGPHRTATLSDVCEEHQK